MTSKQAAQHNDAYPFTVAPCDNNRSFEVRSFATLAAARAYAATRAPRPWIVALPAGNIVAASVTS